MTALSLPDEFLRVGKKYAPFESLRTALEAVGNESISGFELLSGEPRALLINRLVRNIRNLAVEQCPVLEREMLAEFGAGPSGERHFNLGNALELITQRNHLRHCCVWMGLDWSRSMKLQAAVSEVIRSASEYGALRFTTSAEVDCVRCSLTVPVPAGAPGFDFRAHPSTQVIRELAHGRWSHQVGQDLLEFEIHRP